MNPSELREAFLREPSSYPVSANGIAELFARIIFRLTHLTKAIFSRHLVYTL
jgi:hypothetical protein